MTVPKWNPTTFDRTMKPHHHDHQGSAARPPRRNLGRILALAALAGMVVAGAAAANTIIDEERMVGVCHATGAAAGPYVLLRVKEDGFEHGHHRSHASDFFVDAASPDCSALVYPHPVEAPEADTNATDAPSEEPEADTNATDAPSEEPEADTNATDAPSEEPEADTNATDAPSEEPEADTNATDAPSEEPEADANATDPASEEPEPDANATDPASEEPEADANTTDVPAEEPTTSGDASVVQTATQDDRSVVLFLRIENLGDGALADVSLTDALPDVRRPWLLEGADADACVLDGNQLTCWFGALAPGEGRDLSLRAYTDRLPCGESMTNTAWVSAPDDAEPRNDGSSAGILARYC